MSRSLLGAISKIGSLERSFAWSLTTDGASKASVLLLSLIAVRKLQPIAFGQFVGLLATSVLTAYVWDLGLGTLLTRQLSGHQVDFRPLIWPCAGLRLKTLPIAITTYLVGIWVIGRYRPISWSVLLLFAASSLATGAYLIPLGFLRGRLQFREAGIALVSGRWLSVVVVLLSIVSQAADPLVTFSLAVFAGEAMTLLLATILSLTSPNSGSQLEASQLSVRSAAPYGANSLLATAYNRFDVVVLAALSTPTQLAAYAPASRIQDALYLVPGSIGVVALAFLSRGWFQDGPDQTFQTMRKLILAGLAICLPVAVLVFAFAPIIITFILGDGYAPSVGPTRIMLWSMPLAAVGAPVLAALAASGRAIDTTKAFAAAFLAALALHLGLDWWAGAVGAAIASTVRDMVNVFASLTFLRQRGFLRGARFS